MKKKFVFVIGVALVATFLTISLTGQRFHSESSAEISLSSLFRQAYAISEGGGDYCKDGTMCKWERCSIHTPDQSCNINGDLNTCYKFVPCP